ncbi:MAG: outer membrane protein assembly factor BamB [Magnetococcus sp. DMHC-6]
MRRFWLIFAVLIFSGCSSGPNWLGGEAKKAPSATEPEAIEEFNAPQPGKSTALVTLWKSSLASAPGKYDQHPGRFVVDREEIFVGTFQGHVVCVSAQDGREKWNVAIAETVMGGVAVDGQRVFAGTINGEMVALDRQSGQELWRTQVSTTVASAPTVAGTRVLFMTLDNRTYALDVQSGKRIWMHARPPQDLVMHGAAPPEVVNNGVFVGYSSGEVFALSLENGTPLWSQNLTVARGRGELDLIQDVDAGVVIPTDSKMKARAFTVNHQGNVVALHLSTGNYVWKRILSAVRPPLFYQEKLYVADMDGALQALNGEDGLPLWTVRLSSGLLTAPVQFRERIFIADNQEHLFSLDPLTGNLLGRDDLGDPILADPLVRDGSLYLWTNDGNLIKFQ